MMNMPELKPRSVFKQGIGKHGNQTIYDVSEEEITENDINNLNYFQGNPHMYNKTAGNTEKLLSLIKSGKISTIGDLENYVYGGSFLDLQKTVTTSTSNAYDALYGRRAWDQVNREDSLFSLIRKVAWSRNGWRMITDEASDDPNYGLEDGSIPEGEDFTAQKLLVSPSSIIRRNVRSDLFDMTYQLNEGIDPHELAMWLSARHRQIINAQLLAVNEAAHTTAGLYSIDRIISNYAEYAYGNVANSAVITSTYLSVFGKARAASGADYMNCSVDGQAFASGDRQLTLSMLDKTLKNIRTNFGKINPSDYLILTHPDTAVEIDNLCATNQRYSGLMGTAFISGGVSGMQVAEQRSGIEGAMQVSTWKGIPIFEDPNVVQDGIGRIYIINLNHLFMSVLVPTQYYQWEGPETTAAFNINMLYRTVGNLVCTNFRSNGKIRDLDD